MTRSISGYIDALEDVRGLDRLAEPLASVVSKVVGRGPLNDLLSGTQVGHPAHPALVLVPIGSWLSASLLDVAGGPQARPAATRLTGLGVLAAVPAALAGASDWTDTLGGERRVGLVHALANLGGVALFTGSWLARRRGRHTQGALLSAVGVLAATGSAWLGGHLTYALGVGVDTTAFQGLPQEWTDVAAEGDVAEGRALEVHADGTPVLLTRVGGAVVALADRCTHRGGPLHEGEIADGCVTCPWHGSRFELRDGSVQHGPATRPAATFEVRTSGGRVQVRRAGETRSLRTNPVS